MDMKPELRQPGSFLTHCSLILLSLSNSFRTLWRKRLSSYSLGMCWEQFQSQASTVKTMACSMRAP